MCGCRDTRHRLDRGGSPGRGAPATISVAAAGLTAPAGHLTYCQPCCPQKGGRPAWGWGSAHLSLGHCPHSSGSLCAAGRQRLGARTNRTRQRTVEPDQALQRQGPLTAVSRVIRGGGGGDRRLESFHLLPLQSLRGTEPHPATLGAARGQAAAPWGRSGGQGAGTGGHQAWRICQRTRRYQVFSSSFLSPQLTSPCVHLCAEDMGRVPRARPPRPRWTGLGRGQSVHQQVAHPRRKLSSETAPRPSAGLRAQVQGGPVCGGPGLRDTGQGQVLRFSRHREKSGSAAWALDGWGQGVGSPQPLPREGGFPGEEPTQPSLL